MKSIKGLLILFLISCILESCTQSENNFSEAVTQFHTNTKETTTLYFYPSTLKILNFNKDSVFNEVIKGIRKLKITKLSKDTIDFKVVSKLTDAIKKEKFVYLMELKQTGYQVILYLKNKDNKPKEYIGVIYNQKDMTVIDLVGDVRLKFLPALLSGNIKLGGFETVFKATPKANKNQPPKPKHGNNTGDK